MVLSLIVNADSAGTTNRSLFISHPNYERRRNKERYAQDFSDREVRNDDVSDTIAERPCSGGSANSGLGVLLIRWKVTSIRTSESDVHSLSFSLGRELVGECATFNLAW